jgi:hypothetical protein
MGLKEKLFNIFKKEPQELPESRIVLEHVYQNPYAIHYNSQGNKIEYTGDYDNLILAYNNKGLPVITEEEEDQLEIAFLWTDPHYISWVDQVDFQGVLKPYLLFYDEVNAITNSPAVEIVELNNDVVGFHDYKDLFNKRAKYIKSLKGIY